MELWLLAIARCLIVVALAGVAAALWMRERPP